MLVTFSSKAWADITMFGDVAVRMLNLMGHSGTVPSALLAEDVPAALDKLKTAIEAERAAPSDQSDGDVPEEERIDLAVRAHPLIQLLTAAAEQRCDVMWHN